MTIDIGLARSYNRTADQKRPTKITRGFLDSAAGSCLIETGNTKVLCAVTIEERVQPWRKGSNLGWVTAEYAMLPASTAKRTPREYNARKGRSMEIERLIGRSLRTVVDMGALGGEVTFHVDCDVIQADGGIDENTIVDCAAAGADCFAVGSAVFKSADRAKTIAGLREAAERVYLSKV